LIACTPTEPPTSAGSFLLLTSTAFNNGESIPGRFTCVGENISPPLQWNEPPAGTRSLALIMDDPDAPSGDWVHWVILHISAETRSLAENLKPDSSSIIFGENSAGESVYGGPCPPSGTHHYVFRLYALDIVLPLDTSANKSQVLNAMDGHVLAFGELIGLFTK